KHQFDIAEPARAQDGAQLRLEDFRMLEAKADGAPTQKRIKFVADIDSAGDLVAAKIECSNDERMGPDGFGDAPIRLILLLLARQGIAIEIKKFGAIQPDSLGAVSRDAVNIVGQLNVRRQDNVIAIQGRGRPLTQ